MWGWEAGRNTLLALGLHAHPSPGPGWFGGAALSGWILDLVWLKPPTDPQAAALLLEAKAWLPPFPGPVTPSRRAFRIVLLCRAGS